MPFRSSSPLLVAAGLAILLSAATLAPPLLARGFPSGHDTTAHLTYVYLFDAALSQGQFPVRWIEWIRPGHSQPLFNFYQPGFYYTVQLVQVFAGSLLLSTKLTILLAWWCGALFLFLFLRRLGPWPAALGALLFMRAPYLILDVFVRAAFPEFLALACVPAVLWALDRTLGSRSWAYPLILAAATALMLLSHLPTVLMFVPVFTAYVVCVWAAGSAVARNVPRAVGAVALGLALACFYVAPALLELRFTKIRALTSAYYDYRIHFVQPWQWFSTAWGYGGSERGAADRMSFQLGVVQWVAVGSGLVAAVLAWKRRTGGEFGRLVFWIAVTSCGLLMTNAASAAIWSRVAPLAFVQFPWRFLTVASLAAAVAGALALARIERRPVQAAVVLCAAGALFWQTQGLLKPSHYVPRRLMYIDNPGWRYAPDAGRMAFIEPGYYPATVRRVPEDPIERWRIERGAGEVSPREVRDDRLTLDVTTPGGMTLTIASHAFPGWQVRIDGAIVPWRIDSPFGFIVVDVPPGTHRVEAVFEDTPVRAWSNRTSMLGATLWGAIAVAWGLERGRGPRRARRNRRLADVEPGPPTGH